MRYTSFSILGISLLLLTNCAGYKILREDSSDKKQEGLRFYRPQPYLLVSEVAPAEKTDKDSPTVPSLSFEVIYLPDYEHGYVLQRHGGLGTVDASATLTNGWNLAALAQKTDSQLPQTIEAVSKLIPTLLTAPFGSKVAAPNAPPIPGLYKINLEGNKAPCLIRVHE